jgi:putative Mg2+ transporter-C (MgtC) family protein
MAAAWYELWHGFSADFEAMPDWQFIGRTAARLFVAALLGGLLGYDRERRGKKAGFRTHMLVSLGAALFVLIVLQASGDATDISRVIQGVVVGIGFLGAGSIVKHQDTDEIQGLTTAASVWFTSAVGLAAGNGRFAAALMGTVLALVVLMTLAPLERWMHRRKVQQAKQAPQDKHTTPRANDDSQ